MTKKRGQLSLEEEKFIKDNINSLSIEEISNTLNRSEAPIKRYATENQLYESDESKTEYTTLKQKLHGKTFWKEISRQFDSESGELEYFEDVWINLIKQFREDVLPA